MDANTLRQRLGAFLSSSSSPASAARRVLRQLRSAGLPVAVCSGVNLDLLTVWPDVRPRDVDLVVDAPPGFALDSLFPGLVERRTRYGGLQLHVDGIAVDLWPLRNTWAFPQLGVTAPVFADLTRISFVDTQAVVVELEGLNPSRVWSAGFFEAVAARTMELHFGFQIFPSYLAGHAMAKARKIGFEVGPRLQSYVDRLEHCD